MVSEKTIKKTDQILIKGARVHNLKNVDVAIPLNKLVVITGVSGSGKSSLTIDTLYAEGQRRYVESLSSYARQFLMRMDKPDVDHIHGICPAIAIEQKVNTRNSRSTVGTMTEIFDYLRLLYARVGRTFSPVSGKEVKKHTVTDVVDFIMSHKEGAKVQLFAPFKKIHHRSVKEELDILLKKGFNRVQVNNELQRIEDILEEKKIKIKEEDIRLLVDRFVVRHDEEENISRMADSIETAFFEGEGDIFIEIRNLPVRQAGQKSEIRNFNNCFELDGITFEEPTPHFFSFNSPYGACPTCEGFGYVIGIDADLVVPNKQLSVYDGAVAAWSGIKMSKWKDQFIKNAHKVDFPIHRDYRYLTEQEKKYLWEGSKHFKGINDFFEYVESKSYKIQYRVLLSRYRGKTVCPDCKGTRIRKEAGYVKINERSIIDVVLMPVSEAHQFFTSVQLSPHDKKIADRLLSEINNRLSVMLDVGLGYLTLNRTAKTLSGGETQRINLTRMLGSNLTSSLYILDEPSIGLHPKDGDRLIKVLKELRDLGNTVVVVEHEEDMIRAADYVVDMGPFAGIHGGEVIFQGNREKLLKDKDSLTAKYLRDELQIPLPDQRRKSRQFMEIKGASQHNLKNIDVKFPLNVFTVVTGVSGSGKTTLVKQILYPALKKKMEGQGEKAGEYQSIEGDTKNIAKVEMIDQNPIGKSSRSNPVTYVKAYDAIRDLYANQQLSKIRGFKPKHFSFNVDGGRCEACKGEGETVVEMQFLADVHLVCEECKGKRFKQEVLEVLYKEKNIADVLELSIEEALEFFRDRNEILTKLEPLFEVGLGYVKLGQSSDTLSGGEAQRVKLASFLSKGKNPEPILFIFDEPTTGLHFHDINKLLKSFNALIEQGHSIVVIEHNMEVIKCADWIIDLGPEGGAKGGNLLFQGVPEDLLKIENSHTAKYLKEKLS